MTGVGTVLADDPSLSVRREELGVVDAPRQAVLRQPMRVVVDSHFRTPASAKLLTLDGKTLVAGIDSLDSAGKLASASAEVTRLPERQGRTDLHALLELLAERRVNEVLLESGPTLSGAMLQAGLIDELVIYVAPKLMGDNARGLLTMPGLERLDAALEVDITDVRPIGRDWRITAVPRKS